MNKNTNIRYLKRHEIDEGKWSRCIEEAANSRVYANHWYLDKAAEDWEALVLGDYQFVMPLPVRKKWGIKYVFQPLFCQQLGIFPVPSTEIKEIFINFLTLHFRFCETNLNSQNPESVSDKLLNINPRQNYLLPLAEGYESLATGFSINTKRNISKSAKKGLQLVTGMQTADFIAFKKEHSNGRLTSQDTQNMRNLVSALQYKGLGEIQGVYTTKNELCAAVFFLRWKNRLIYLSASSGEEGKNEGAMYFLVSQAIQKLAGQPLILDFEGSMVPGVARFYAGFGAFSETYFQLRINQLPWPLKLLKK